MGPFSYILGFLAWTSIALASTDDFSLLVILSGSPIQNTGVKVSDTSLQLGGTSTTFFEGSIQDDGSLKLSSGKYVTVSPDGTLGIGSTGTTGFSITSYGLYFEGQGFYACPLPGGTTYSVVSSAIGSSCNNGYSPILSPIDKNGQQIALTSAASSAASESLSSGTADAVADGSASASESDDVTSSSSTSPSSQVVTSKSSGHSSVTTTDAGSSTITTTDSSKSSTDALSSASASDSSSKSESVSSKSSASSTTSSQNAGQSLEYSVFSALSLFAGLIFL